MKEFAALKSLKINPRRGMVAAATAEVLRILAVNVENPLGFSSIRSAKWERQANSNKDNFGPA